jgi:hypothetical protein
VQVQEISEIMMVMAMAFSQYCPSTQARLSALATEQ